jgi:hypothetical protein
MIKKLFDWTPRDISKWETIRKKGLRHFVLWYGVVLFGGIMFSFLGGIAFLAWSKAFLEDKVALSVAAIPRFIFLVLELIFIAAVCLAGGLINSLVTWVVEENIYRKYKKRIVEAEPIKTQQP